MAGRDRVYADKVIKFFDSGTGPIPGPYGSIGGTPTGNEPYTIETVTPNVVLGPPPPSPIIGSNPKVDWLALPTRSFVTVGFTENKIIDGPGNDIFIRSFDPEDSAGESADIFVSSNQTDFEYLGRVGEDGVAELDLASIGFTKAVKAVKIVGVDNLGTSPGFDLIGVEALNSRATPSSNIINGNNRNNRLNGTSRNETIDGKNGNDVLNGGGGNDNLIGGGGNDRLIGSSGKDTLTGDDGNDRLDGGSGNDILTGGGGRDQFLFGNNKIYRAKDIGTDTITDFRPGFDDIILDKDTFISLHSRAGTGFSVNREFAIVSNKRAVAGSVADIVYDRSTGDLYYNPNSAFGGFGGGGKFATLEGAPTISESDFVLQ